jgi:hypothetical protein
VAECVAGAKEFLAADMAERAGRVTPGPAAPVPQPGHRTRSLGPPVRGRHRVGPFAALGHRFVVDSANAELLDTVARVLAPLATREPATERHVVRGADHAVVIGSLMSLVNGRAVASVADAATVHAAAVERDGYGLVLVGASGSGKSTLAAGLVQAGWGYLTDEVAAIATDSGRLWPYPKPVSLRPESWPLFPAAHEGVQAGEARLVDPRALGEGRLGQPVIVSSVIFPTFSAGASTALTRVSPAETLVRLVGNWYPASTSIPDVFTTLVNVARSAPGWNLVHGDLAGAVTVIGRITSETGEVTT